jgi:hypothetical protein
MSLLPTTVNLINKFHEDKKENPRPHLGCSVIGHNCERWLWLSFHWAVIPKFEGRILRLFRRGHNEEANILRDLRSIGVDVRATQNKVDFGKHFGGSVDGIIHSGLPESPNKVHLAEFKTHSKKSFDDLVKNGMQKSKPMHYAQMQVYMLGLKLDRGFYYAVCKDNDEIYTERVKLDKEFAIKMVTKAHRITMVEALPPPLSTDPSWYECKMCDAHDFCHGSKAIKESNCRTCAHVTSNEDSTWTCTRYDAVIPLEAQYNGCDAHVIHPDLVPYKFKPGKDEWHAIYIINNKEVLNGADGFKSSEILANPSECAEPSDFTKELRETMGAKIINAS